MTTEELMQMCLGMMAGDDRDVEVIREIEEMPSRAWKRYAQAFSGLDAQEITEG